MTEPTLPISEYCQVFREWAGLMRARATEAVANGEAGYSGERWKKIADALDVVNVAIVKSCYLDRRLYGGEDTRTERCPIHKGHWSGCVWGEGMCPEGCQYGSNVTGWLPKPHLYVQAPEDTPTATYTHTRCYQCGGTREAEIHVSRAGAWQ